MNTYKILILGISIGIAGLGLGIGYYYGVVLPNYNESKILLEQTKIDSDEKRRLVEEQRVEKQEKEKRCKDDIKTMVDMQLGLIDTCTLNAGKPLNDWDQKVECSKRKDIKEIEDKRMSKQLECKEFLPLMK